MGAACTYQKGESEDETITRILSSMSLNGIETKSAYNEFLKCLNEDDAYLDFFQFKSFLTRIIGENVYKKAQLSFFENLRQIEALSIKLIGILIIYLSKGSNYQKIESLSEHFERFYHKYDETSVKIFLNNVIELHTDLCLLSFKENLDSETVQNLSEVWSKIRKLKLCSHMFMNYESIKAKGIFMQKSPLIIGKKPGQAIESDMTLAQSNPNFKSTNKEVLLDTGDREDICEYYEKHNKTQSDHFFNSSGFKFSTKKLSDQEKGIKEFIELSFSQLDGGYIRSWLYEDYIKEKSNTTDNN